MNDLPGLQDAIRKAVGCDSSHVESVDVTEMFQGQAVWEGTVEVFDLIGDAKTPRCYAWNYRQDDGTTRYMMIFHVPPVDSPRKAVQAAIAAENRSK